MQEFRNHLIGIDQGDVVLFSDFEDGGAMWTGTGPRVRRKPVWFSQRFRRPPVVHVSISLLDADTDTALRAELVAENITRDRFEIVFRTWLDSRVARFRAAWMAIGELPDDGAWDID
jgi:hypothetical protein